ncbi:hypothetical protein PATA110616_07635 [Paenibacillus tarimensis]
MKFLLFVLLLSVVGGVLDARITDHNRKGVR